MISSAPMLMLVPQRTNYTISKALAAQLSFTFRARRAEAFFDGQMNTSTQIHQQK